MVICGQWSCNYKINGLALFQGMIDYSVVTNGAKSIVINQVSMWPRKISVRCNGAGSNRDDFLNMLRQIDTLEDTVDRENN